MVGLGDTAKKVQTVADRAEKTYKRLEELREQVRETRETVDDTNERVRALERTVAEQRAILDALAAESGVDVEAALRDAVDDDPDITVKEET